MNKSELLKKMSESAEKLDTIRKAESVNIGYYTGKSELNLHVKNNQTNEYKNVKNFLDVYETREILCLLKKFEIKKYNELKKEFMEVEENE